MTAEYSNSFPFAHLHIHSEYSLLDGSIKIKKLIKELKRQGAVAAALTDHDAMHGSMEFYLGCAAEGISGIIGYEANVEIYSPELAVKGLDFSHLVLLAETTAGYQNLIKLSSYANTLGKTFKGKESYHLSWKQIEECSEGLICLTSCQKGELSLLVSSASVTNDFSKETEPSSAKNFLNFLTSVFGKNQVFAELIDNNLPGQRDLIQKIADVAGQAEIPIVATADVHYLLPSDVQTHLSLLAIKQKLQRTELQKVRTNYHFHLATPQEMYRKFERYPEALANTMVIANRCKVKIDTKSVFMPDFRERPNESADDCLIRLSREGLTNRKPAIMTYLGVDFSEDIWKSYETRLEYELDVIIKMKFSGYFLIVQDFINWAKRKDIPVGPGRGSAAGSLVTYALAITNIDPLRFNLLFERFLNPDRISMPDIDTDFCQDRRAEVISYVYERYGAANVSQIVTFGRMMARNAIKNLARITGWSFHEANDFAKLVPETPGITLEQAYLDEEKIRQRLEGDDRAKSLWQGSIEIEGILNSLGIHAAGVIISDAPLNSRCPMMESEGQLVTQLENKYAEKIGLIKFDFLGLKTLTVIDKCIKLVKSLRCPEFDIDTIDIDDPVVYQNISTAHVTGIFQLESNGMRKLIADLQPTCFTDIIAILALFRPGPLGSGMVEDFVLRKHGKNPVEYLFPELEPILNDTYGVIVYQEQVQKIAAVLASYSLGEADLLRRAMGKKDKLEMERQKNRFVEGAQKNGHDSQKASDLFDLMAKFAEYGFNKSHTAAYGWVTLQTAYLKTYYPAEFMASIMSCDLDNTEKIAGYWTDCKRMNIVLLPPDINSSLYEFSIEGPNTIRFGLGAVKGLGKGIIELIVKSRSEDGKFYSVPEFMARVDARKLNKKILEVLISSGSFDSISTNRAELLANSEAWMRLIAKARERKDSFGAGLFSEEDDADSNEETLRVTAVSRENELKIHEGSLPSELIPSIVLGAKKANVLKREFDPLKKETRLDASMPWVKNLLMGVNLKKEAPWSILETLKREFDALGFYCTGHPSDLFEADFEQFSTGRLDGLLPFIDGEDVPFYKRKPLKVAGMVSQVFEKKTKENEKFCVVKIDDGRAELEIAVFPKQFAALDFSFKVGEPVWFEIHAKKGVELGTVKGQCVAVGSLLEKRQQALKSVLVTCGSEIAENPKLALKLKQTIENHKGNVPCRIKINFAKDNLAFNGTLAKIGIHPTDAFFVQMSEILPGVVKTNSVYTAI